jgi:hypothetical protein
LHPPIWYIKWLIRKNLVPGTIVILHDGIPDPTRSIKALPYVLEHGLEKGLTFVSIGELMRGRQEREDVNLAENATFRDLKSPGSFPKHAEQQKTSTRKRARSNACACGGVAP